MCGLEPEDLAEITTIISAFPQVEDALIFGSRARGNYNRGSDIDIAIKGENAEEALWEIHDMLEEETFMPYKFDVIHFESIESAELRKHINKDGISLLKPESAKPSKQS